MPLSNPASSSTGGITQSYLGYNTVGGSAVDMTVWRVYAKQITMSSAGLLSSIDAHIRTNANDGAGGVNVGVYTDSSGTPDLIIAHTAQPSSATYMSKASATVGTYRWVSFAVGMWLPAADYWICVQHNSSAATRMTIKYDATGADRTYDSGFDGFADWGGLYSPTTTANAYSIRASILR